MDNLQLSQLQALDLETKIMKTKARIREWYYHWNGEVYISFSGGKDSTVLLDIVRQEFPNVPAVFIDTGLEYPEIRQFAQSFDNVETVKPKMQFKEVVEKYGYPVIGKEVANIIYYARKGKQWAINRLEGLEFDGNYRNNSWKERYKKHKYLIDAPFKISDNCCKIMKKEPAARYAKETNRKAFVGMLAEESALRKTHYVKHGCNSFDSKTPKSNPLGFWKEQDILKYIYTRNLTICSVYGKVQQLDLFGECFETTGQKRTGCFACMFGITHDRTPNRFQSMKRTHPKLYDYCMREENGLGLAKILNYLQIKY
jgi:3'-phosphoadenosine 5'-phosphosulfate sulfotransferase (PAPS reductase)/FAD synthetase